MNEEIKSEFGNRIRIRVCGILIRDEEILLAEHTGLVNNGSLFIPPGGGVEFGESLSRALHREFREETGMNIEVGKLLTIHEFIDPPLHAVEFFFIVTAENGDMPRTGRDPELKEKQIIDNVKFVTFDELRIMKDENKHQILRNIKEKSDLLNLSRHFKLS